jgi:hypothetical protein
MNGTYIEPERSRREIERRLADSSDEELRAASECYLNWVNGGVLDFSSTVVYEIWIKYLEEINPNKIYGQLQAYDAVCREIAKRCLEKEQQEDK